MNDDIRSAVRQYVRTAREHPGDALGPALDELDRKARSERSGSYVAQTSPVADYTWLNRLVLDKTLAQSEEDPIYIPYPIEIVGMLPTILLIDADQTVVEPPPEAIDVFLQINQKDTLTARSNRRTAQGQSPQVVNLPAISCTIGNRLFGKVLDEQSNTFSIRFQWAVDLATVAALKWGTVQISLNWFVLDREDLRK